jgi:hypothetical protein
LSWEEITTLPLELKTTNPKESFGLSLEKNILMASLAKLNRDVELLLVNPEFIEPETSRQMTELRIL